MARSKTIGSSLGRCDIGKKSTKTTTTTAPPSWAVGNLQGAGNAILGTVNQNQGALQGLASGITGQLPGLWNAAGDTSALQPAVNYASDVLGGKYLNSNPYLNDMVHQGEEDAANRVNSTFSQYGRTGSTDHSIGLAKGVAQAGDAIRYGDYSAERQRMGDAAGLLPGINASRFAGVTPALAATQLAGQLPYYGIQNLGQIGGLYSGYGTSTGKQPGGWGSDLLSAGVAALPFIPGISDRRLKTNIKKLGEAKDGLGIYEWNWKAAPNGEPVRGVIADEVEKLRPWAFVPNFVGEYAGVNYAALGSLA